MTTATQPMKEERRETSAHDSFRLARFVADLAQDRDRLQDFLSTDRESVMAAAGLTHREKDLLREGTMQAVLDHIWEVGDKPTPPDEPPADPPPGG